MEIKIVLKSTKVLGLKVEFIVDTENNYLDIIDKYLKDLETNENKLLSLVGTFKF